MAIMTAYNEAVSKAFAKAPTKITPPLVQVSWLQAFVSELDEPAPRAIPSVTVGFLLSDDGVELVVAQTSHSGRYANITVIPRGAVSGMKRLRTGALQN
jgi:hypothetical protein